MDSAGRDALRPRTAPEDPEEFEPGSEGPVVPLAYGLVGTAVVLAGGVTVLLMLAGPGNVPIRYLAHHCWTWAARVGSFGLIDRTIDCGVPFDDPDPDTSVYLARNCVWVLPVNLAAALIATACLRRAIPECRRYLRELMEGGVRGMLKTGTRRTGRPR